MHRRPARLIVALAVCLVTLGGCGGFARSGSSEDAAAGEEAEVGGGLGLDRTTTTTAPATPGGGAGGDAGSSAAPADQGDPDGDGFENVATRTDPSGFKLTLTVDGRLRYSTKDNLKLQLDIENVSGKVLRYDANQVRYFQIKPADGRSSPTWSDDSCTPEKNAYQAPPVSLEPGESVTLAISGYPSDDFGPSGESCRVLTAGKYSVLGAVNWCPDSAYRDGMCDPKGIKGVASSPVVITLS